MKKAIYTSLCAMLLFSSASVTIAKDVKPIELTPAELTAVQTKTYAAPASIAFPATVATLQTLGYLNITASKDAGTISGETEAKGKVIYNILWGFGKKKHTQLASLLVEQTSTSKTTVKLNLAINESKSRGFMGNNFKDGQIVKIADPYNEFYTVLDAEIAKREAAK